MRRYVVYDRNTGEILHTHQVFNFGSEDPVDVPVEEVIRLTSRMIDPARAECVVFSDPVESSSKALRSVNTRSQQVVTRRAARDYWTKRRGRQSSPRRASSRGQ